MTKSMHVQLKMSLKELNLIKLVKEMCFEAEHAAWLSLSYCEKQPICTSSDNRKYVIGGEIDFIYESCKHS